MSKIKSYKIEMRPYYCPENSMYEVTTIVNDEKISVARVISDQLPHEAELETLNRMGMEIIRNLRDKEKHGSCCDCCEKKKCPKY